MALADLTVRIRGACMERDIAGAQKPSGNGERGASFAPPPEGAERGRGMAVGCVGYGLFLCWMWVVYFSNSAVLRADMGVEHVALFRIVMLVAAAIALPAFGSMERSFVTKRGVVVSGVLSVMLCPLASLAALAFPCTCVQACALPCGCASLVVHAVAWALSGVGYALFAVYWAWFLVALAGSRRHALVVASAMVVSAVAFFVAALFLPRVSLAVHALLPAASIACSVYAHRALVRNTASLAVKSEPPETMSGVAARLSKKALMLTWFSGVSLGFCGYVVACGPLAAGAGDTLLSALILATSFVLYAVVRKTGSFPLSRFMWLYVPVVSFCLVPMCLLGPMGRVVCAGVLIAVLTAYSFADLDMLVLDMKTIAPHVTKVMARGRLGNIVGMIVGWLAAGTVGALAPGDDSWFMRECLVLVLVLILASAVIFRDSGFRDAPAMVERPASDYYEAQCAKFARAYGLTQRQRDVLPLLGRGRTAATIQEKLFISESTAKTHIYNIYQKVGIHTQRELMELLDAVEVTEDDLNAPSVQE